MSLLEDIEEHMKSKHGKTNAPFPCETCGLVVANHHLLEEHMNICLPSMKETCHYCEFECSDKDGLQSHMLDIHGEKVILHTMGKQVNELNEVLERDLHHLKPLNLKSQMF